MAIVCALAVSAVRVGAQSALPTGWSSRDIGSVGLAGSASVVSGTWTIDGSGANIWATSDEFQFAYQQVTGDFDIRVRVASLENVNAWSKAGVMIRESLAANARNAFMLVTSGWRRVRSSAAATRAVRRRGRRCGSGTAPVWLRLVRQGNQFTGYQSANGTSWTSTGSATISMTSSVYVGMAVGSRVDSTLATAMFTNFQTASGRSRSTTGLPAPWTNRDIGSPARAGSASASAARSPLLGGGADIWDTSDQFQFVYQPLQGDVEVIARVGFASVCGSVVEGRRHDPRIADGRFASCVHDGIWHAGMGVSSAGSRPAARRYHHAGPRRSPGLGAPRSRRAISSARIIRPTERHGRSSAPTPSRWRRRSTSASR